LARLLSLATRHRVPVAVAAIPALVAPSLVAAIARCDFAVVVQHGYAHRNRAMEGGRSMELVDGDATLADLARGRVIVERPFGERFAPILVPPWNRIADGLLPSLRDGGYAGLSRFGPRASRLAAAGVVEVNTHVDPIAWRRGRAFAGVETCVARIVEHLRSRRAGACDAREPTGLLTHHLAFGDDAFAFTDAVLAVTRGHDAARWLDARAAFEGELTCVRSA
jgi:hypothetical protein